MQQIQSYKNVKVILSDRDLFDSHAKPKPPRLIQEYSDGCQTRAQSYRSAATNKNTSTISATKKLI